MRPVALQICEEVFLRIAFMDNGEIALRILNADLTMMFDNVWAEYVKNDMMKIYS